MNFALRDYLHKTAKPCRHNKRKVCIRMCLTCENNLNQMEN